MLIKIGDFEYSQVWDGVFYRDYLIICKYLIGRLELLLSL